MQRRRLDVEMVRRGLVSSRQQAERLVEAGRVLVDGSVAQKCARLVGAGQAVAVSGPPARFVSRGGEKLDHALDRLAVAVAGRECLDVGASTGGFTDCLLQRGAVRVVAVDAGHGQIHPRLRSDERVVVLERTNARTLLDDHPDLRGGFDLVVADVSFISLTVLMPVLVECQRDGGGDMLVMVKPQFEAGRAEVSRGAGVVRDPAVRLAAVTRVAAAMEACGLRVAGAVASPVLGPAGNAEFFLHGQAAGGGSAVGADSTVAALLERAVAEAPTGVGAAADGT